MTKFTATQTEILNQASERGIVGVQQHFGTGANGGDVRGGSRRYEAARKLVEMGLLEVVARHRDIIQAQGHTSYTHSMTLRPVA